MKQPFSTPTAIVIAGGLLSIAVFLGLQQRPTVSVMTPQPMPLSAATPPPAWVPVAQEVQREVAEVAQQAMEKHRAELAATCLAGKKGAAKQNFEFRMIFDDRGRLLTYLVNDPPDDAGRAVAKCLRDRRPDVTVPPPGKPVTVQFELPMP